MGLEIVQASSPRDIGVVAQLFKAYTEALGIDLAYQGYAAEVAGLPGKYAPPEGELLLAYTKNREKALGCVALRPLPPSAADRSKPGEIRATARICEIKRLYVSPDARGLGLGRLLAEQMIQRAKDLGYGEMRLDTLASMDRAQDLYRRLGFVEIGAYYTTPIAGTVFLSLDLGGASE